MSRGDNSVKLEPRVMDLLVYMSRNPEHVHSREELLDNVWTGMVVSDEALTNAIIKLRKVFEDDAHHPQYIKTLPKRGYRLIAEVTVDPLPQAETPQKPVTIKKGHSKLGQFLLASLAVVVVITGIIGFLVNFQESEQQPSAPEPDVLELPEKPSIAVLPFMNIGNEIEHSYFSDGITDDLITDLSKLSGLFVISRNSTFQYKGQAVDVRQVASKLGVHYVLEGSVRRSGQRVRVNTQLIDGQSGRQLWAERYDGELEDVFALQDKMTIKIINALALKLTDQDQTRLLQVETTSAEAYDEFLRGMELRWRIDRESYAQAEKHFNNALKLDPDYARPHAALALLYLQIWQQGWHQNAGSQSAGWSRARVQLDLAMSKPDPLTHSLRSTMQLHNRRFEKAIEEAQIAVSLNPSSATGYLALAEAFSYSGQSIEAIENAKKARRRDPNFSAPYLLVEGRALFDLKQYKAAVETLERASLANQANYNPLAITIASLGQLGRIDEAKTKLDQLNTLLKQDDLPAFTLSTLRHRLPYQDHADLDHLKEGLLKGQVPKW